MRIRPTDETGDILPVLSAGALLTGAEAAAGLVRYRLNLLTGEWWENPSHGCAVFSMLREGRITAADRDTLASYIASYIRSTPGVQSVENVSASAAGRQFTFSCDLRTAAGSAGISYTIST